MADEVVQTSVSKTEIKLTQRKNVIPITSLSDLGTVVGEIQNQLTLLIGRLENDVSPEFKALMEGYINKANETEELKVKLENIISSSEGLKTEITKVRDTNRNLIHELQSTREALKRIELEFNNFQESAKKTEEEFKAKVKKITQENNDFESKIKLLEEEKSSLERQYETKLQEVTENLEKVRQGMLDQNYKFHQSEQEITIQRDNLSKQVEEFSILLKDQAEKLELKTKEVEYKDALLNQFIKQATTEKLKLQNQLTENKDKPEKKNKLWFFN